MVEEGRDLPYIEHWHQASTSDPNPCVALRLRAVDESRDGFLVRVGPRFMYACSRLGPLPALGSLLECLHAAPDQSARLALFDCEIAVGQIEAGRWQILHSSLPWREGMALGPQLAPDAETWTTADLSPEGREIRRRWRLASAEGELAACASAKP